MWYCLFKVVKSHMGYLTSKHGRGTFLFLPLPLLVSHRRRSSNLICVRRVNHLHPQTLRYFLPFHSFVIYLFITMTITSTSKRPLYIHFLITLWRNISSVLFLIVHGNLIYVNGGVVLLLNDIRTELQFL